MPHVSMWPFMAIKPKGTHSLSRSTLVAVLCVIVMGFLFVSLIERLSLDAAGREDPAAAFAQLKNVVLLLWIPSLGLLAYAWYLFRQPQNRKPWVIATLVVLAVLPPLALNFVVNSLGAEAGF